jgi:putative membrane protein
MLEASITKNDKKARWLIGVVSVVIFTAIVLLSRFKLNVDLGFNVHIFAEINAVVNSTIAVLLVAALVAVKNQKYLLHKKLMIAALVLSVLYRMMKNCR